MVGIKKPKEKYKFVFPNAMAKMMAKVNMRTQMESSMLSQGLLDSGMGFIVSYMPVKLSQPDPLLQSSVDIVDVEIEPPTVINDSQELISRSDLGKEIKSTKEIG